MTQARQIADRLLDAQVEFLLAEVTGDRFAEVIARDVAAVLAVGETIRFGDVVSSSRANRRWPRCSTASAAAP